MTLPVDRTSPPIDADVPCVKCGYNLRTLPIDGKCPECALSVAESLDAQRRLAIRLGQDLAEQPRRWLITVASAIIAFLVCVVLSMLIVASVRASNANQPSHQFLVGFGILILLMTLAVWLMTQRPRPELVWGTWWRWAFRGAMTLFMVFAAIAIARAWRGPPPRPIGWAELMFWYSSAAATMAGFACLSHVAGRLRRRWLQWTCRMLAAGSVMMFIWTAHSADIFTRLPPITLPAPDLPLLGPVFDVGLAIVLPRNWSRFGGNWGLILRTELAGAIWIVASTTVMIRLVILLISLAAAKPRKSEPSSHP